MRRLFGALSIAALLLSTTAGRAAAAPPFPHTITLPGASSAEGIATAGGPTFYAGDLFGGDIFRGDLGTGAVSKFITAPAGRNALGIRIDEDNGLLFVAGGFTGQAYVYDPESALRARVNPELVEPHRPEPEHIAELKGLLERHFDLTRSERAKVILSDWGRASTAFWRVAPKADVARISQKNEGTLRGAKA